MDNIVGKESYNALTKTRFIMDIEMSGIFSNKQSLKNFSLNCYSVSTPEIVSGITYKSFQGYKIPIPNGNREEEKILDIGFTVSENLIQYAAMLKWINQITSQFSEGSTIHSENLITTANLWPLDSFLKPLKVPIHYEGLFIGRLGRLEFDQSNQDGSIMKCSASFYYYRSEIDIDSIID